MPAGVPEEAEHRVGEGDRGAVGRRVGRRGEARGGRDGARVHGLGDDVRRAAGEVRARAAVDRLDVVRTDGQRRGGVRGLAVGTDRPRAELCRRGAGRRGAAVEGHRAAVGLPRRCWRCCRDRGREGDRLARGRGVRLRGQGRRGGVGVLGAPGVDEVVGVVLAGALVGAAVVQLDGHARKTGRGVCPRPWPIPRRSAT